MSVSCLECYPRAKYEVLLSLFHLCVVFLVVSQDIYTHLNNQAPVWFLQSSNILLYYINEKHSFSTIENWKLVPKRFGFSNRIYEAYETKIKISLLS